MKLPTTEEELRLFVNERRHLVTSLEDRVREGDKGAFKALKLARKEYNAIVKKLRHQLRHACEDEWRDLLEELLSDAD